MRARDVAWWEASVSLVLLGGSAFPAAIDLTAPAGRPDRGICLMIAAFCVAVALCGLAASGLPRLVWCWARERLRCLRYNLRRRRDFPRARVVRSP